MFNCSLSHGLSLVMVSFQPIGIPPVNTTTNRDSAALFCQKRGYKEHHPAETITYFLHRTHKGRPVSANSLSLLFVQTSDGLITFRKHGEYTNIVCLHLLCADLSWKVCYHMTGKFYKNKQV